MFPPPNKQKKGTSYPKGILQGKKGKKRKKIMHGKFKLQSNCGPLIITKILDMKYSDRTCAKRRVT